MQNLLDRIYKRLQNFVHCLYVKISIQDGRLRIEDEILEVNGVSLTGIANPLAMLRAVLKQAALQAAAASAASVGSNGETASAISTATTAASSASTSKQPDGASGKKRSCNPPPLIRLLIARRIRHRRSASGHTVRETLRSRIRGFSDGMTCTALSPLFSTIS